MPLPMVLFSKSQFLTLLVTGVVLRAGWMFLFTGRGGASARARYRKDDIAIKNVAGQYHLTGELQIAGPIKAPAISLDPWVICLRSPSETHFTIAIFYKTDALVSSREATIADHCDSQAYQSMPK